MEKATVYFTKDLSAKGLMKAYNALGVQLKGKVAVKISTGEPGGHNFLQPALIQDLVKALNGTIVECNTAYGGRRSSSEEHWKAIEEHGFKAIAPCDIMDEEGDMAIPVTGGKHLKENYVGTHLKNYDSILMLSHFKGHAMAGLGGALKNVIALAAGICDGLGFGDNTKAALMTRGIAEMARLGMAMGADFHTFNGLSGVGDLIVTCASMHSRNRKAGILMGQGHSMEEAMEQVHMVVEGVYSAKAALSLAKKYEVEMPIIEQVNQILFSQKSPGEAVKDLMLRDKKIEAGSIDWD